MEGEDAYTYATVIAVGATVSSTVVADAACSDGEYLRLRFDWTSTGDASGVIGYTSIRLTETPRGTFRVLARVKCDGDVYTPYTAMLWGFGYYTYDGDITKTPSYAAGDYYACSADNTWQVLDLGLMTMPAGKSSSIANMDNGINIEIYQYNTDTAFNDNNAVDWDLDYVFLLPIDEGAVIVKTVPADKPVVLDTITDPPAVYIANGIATATVSTSIASYSEYAGAPFNLGTGSTRIYVLRDDAPAVNFEIGVQYQPRFLNF
jgi:hypothetical protein